MSLDSAVSKNQYTGTGNPQVFSYSYKIFVDSDLKVVVKDLTGVETTLVLTTDYLVSNAGNQNGGVVTLVDSSQAWLDSGGDLLLNYVLTIKRVRPITQTSDIRNQGDFYPEGHENAFDHQIMVAQQQQDELDRAVKQKESSTLGILELPEPVANNAIGWNATADALSNLTTLAGAVAVSPFMTTVLDDTTQVDAQATLGIDSASFKPETVVTNGMSPYTVLSTDHVIRALPISGDITIILPSEGGAGAGKGIVIYRIGGSSGYNVIIDPVSAALIQGEATYNLRNDWDGVHIVSNGGTYKIFNEYRRKGINPLQLITDADSPYSIENVQHEAKTSKLMCDATSGVITVNLPPADSYFGTEFTIIKTDSSANTVTVDGNASETINGSLTKILAAQYDRMTVISDGTNWQITDEKSNLVYTSEATGFANTGVTANVPVDSGPSVALIPGTYEIGYDAGLALIWFSGVGYTSAMIEITDSGGTLLADTQALCGGYISTTVARLIYPLSRQTRITITSNTTYKLQHRCSVGSAVTVCGIVNDSYDGILRDPDNTSILIARRIGL